MKIMENKMYVSLDHKTIKQELSQTVFVTGISNLKEKLQNKKIRKIKGGKNKRKPTFKVSHGVKQKNSYKLEMQRQKDRTKI